MIGLCFSLVNFHFTGSPMLYRVVCIDTVMKSDQCIHVQVTSAMFDEAEQPRPAILTEQSLV